MINRKSNLINYAIWVVVLVMSVLVFLSGCSGTNSSGSNVGVNSQGQTTNTPNTANPTEQANTANTANTTNTTNTPNVTQQANTPNAAKTSNPVNTANTTKTTNTANTANTTNPANNTAEQSNKTFTLEQLKQYNGQNGNPAYVAIDGIVYDVTNAKNWKMGMHKGVSAGADLSEEIGQSPHGKTVLGKLPVVGKLTK